MLEKDGLKVTRQDEPGGVLDNLYGYMDWINSSKLIVTPDTLGMHLAIALNKKVLALFGPTPHREVYFYNRGKSIFDTKKDCMPCLKASCEHRTNCMENIPVELVYSEIQKFINNIKSTT